MSMPLSPRSLASLNRHGISPDQHTESESKIFPAVRSSPKSKRSTSSSPFQTEVSGTISVKPPTIKPTNLSVKQGKMSPMDNSILKDPNFDIYMDEDQDTIRFKSTHSSHMVSAKDQVNPSEISYFMKSEPFEPAGDDTLSHMREEIFQSQYHSTSTTNLSDSSNPNIHLEKDDELDMRSVISDDTCFSQFSAVPNVDMTTFANLRTAQNDHTIRSPHPREHQTAQTPGNAKFYTPGTSKRNVGDSASRTPSPSPTPRQKQSYGDTTSLLLDFTQQFRSPSRRGLSPTKTEPNLLAHINSQRGPSPIKATPAGKRNVFSLLDFDLPPQPTPRSVPTITVRELESLKSDYLSEISSLRATLSGKSAEVESLKKAVSDAERRVAEALENLREEKSAKEYIEKQKEEWEKKGQEVECILRNVREEFVYAEKEKEDLLQKLEESNRLREESELKAASAATRACVAQRDAGDSVKQATTDDPSLETIIEQRVAQQLDEKMENLARELHGVYKKKHESKVATLKKTYEARSDKKSRDLQQRLDELSKQNEELQAAKDASFSGEVPNNIASATSLETQQQVEAQKAEIEEQKAKLAGLAEEMNSVRSSHAQLLQDLENERIEKGELVAAVDEMLALQAEVGPHNAVEDLRKSIGRPPSGLRGPGFSATVPPSGLTRPVGNAGGKSRMMMGIERMGKH